MNKVTTLKCNSFTGQESVTSHWVTLTVEGNYCSTIKKKTSSNKRKYLTLSEQPSLISALLNSCRKKQNRKLTRIVKIMSQRCEMIFLGSYYKAVWITQYIQQERLFSNSGSLRSTSGTGRYWEHSVHPPLDWTSFYLTLERIQHNRVTVNHISLFWMRLNAVMDHTCVHVCKWDDSKQILFHWNGEPIPLRV